MSEDRLKSMAGTEPETVIERPVSNAYRNYVLALITITAVLSYLDRQILGILLPQIKEEFGLQDWQLGFLSGPAFSFIFVALTIPIAVVADRISRHTVISVCTLLFSLMTILCGYAASFIHLCIGRFGVGIGEAGTLPASSSILADLFPPEKRATAMAIMGSGINIGLLIAYFAGGLIADHYGWRTAFLLSGGPGLVLGLLFLFTVRVQRSRSRSADEQQRTTFRETLRHMWTMPAYRWLVAGSALATWGLAAMFSFTPLFLVQEHGLSASRVGFILAFYCGILGGGATFAAGWASDRLGKRGLAYSMLVPTVTYSATVPFTFIFYLYPEFNIAIIAGAIPLMLAITYSPPAFALAQTLAPAPMRAQSAAVLITGCYLFGSGLGPFTIGVASDLLHPIVGSRSLSCALILVAFTNAATAYCFWRAFRCLRDSGHSEIRNPQTG